MSKFAIYTKWHWPNGIPSIEDAEKNMKEFSDKTSVTVCKNFSCSLPMFELEKIEELL